LKRTPGKPYIVLEVDFQIKWNPAACRPAGKGHDGLQDSCGHIIRWSCKWSLDRRINPIYCTSCVQCAL